ncbi:MAG: peptidase C39 family protein [Chloroflexota bacterium]|nr:peptidase C39 family protein [Chloroflexota bacterium]
MAGQGDRDGYVATDTLLLYGNPAAYTRYQYRLRLFTTNLSATPRVSLISVMTSDSYKEPAGLTIPSDHQAWGQDLAVPRRSQMTYAGGDGWCSPTSTSMLLGYWGRSVTVPSAAAGTYDYVYHGNGNWPFNTAFAARYGLEAYVTRMGSMAQLEEWISAGIPVAISIGFRSGELAGTPIPSSGGHLIVVRGFTSTGNVITNDPAAPTSDSVRRVYNRTQLQRAWLKYSGGTVYLIYPHGRAVPSSKSYGSW